MEKCKKIVVVGSTNVDLIARVSHLPEPGETIGDAEYCLSYGGKGANQAIAAARSGGHVSFISCLGDDAYADTLITSFVDSGIDVDYIQKCVRHSTGIAFILVLIYISTLENHRKGWSREIPEPVFSIYLTILFPLLSKQKPKTYLYRLLLLPCC